MGDDACLETDDAPLGTAALAAATRPRRLRVPVSRTVALSAYPRGLDLPGIPFLLVHGLASNSWMWDGVAAELERLGHPSIPVDLRGHGRSDKPIEGYDFHSMTIDLTAVIDEMDIEPPVVVGQSWGGNVVMELAARRPERVRAVVAVDGGTIQLQRTFPEWPQAKAALAPPELIGTPVTEIEAFLRAAHPDWPESGIAGALGNFEVRADGTVAPWLGRESHMLILRHLWEHIPPKLYPRIHQPVLFQMAERPGDDRAWASERHQTLDIALEALEDARAEWFRPADHDLHAQFPERCARSIVAFATGVGE